MNNFGEKIKILRTRKKLKQDDIASVLNLSRAQISNLEAGRRNVTLKQLEKLCEYFKVDITYFMLSENTSPRLTCKSAHGSAPIFSDDQGERPAAAHIAFA